LFDDDVLQKGSKLNGSLISVKDVSITIQRKKFEEKVFDENPLTIVFGFKGNNIGGGGVG
jgi:hypothetical protein